MLALVALASVPISLVLTKQVMSRSQGLFVTQWRRTGTLNAHIEETFSGHDLVKVFGRRREAEARFAEENDELYTASFGAQFVSGLIMPLMMFVGNLNYVVIAVLGGLRVASGSMSLGEVQAFIQYSRQFSQPLTQVASMTNLLQSGVASAERVFELLDAEEEVADAAPVAGDRPRCAARSASRTCRSPTPPSGPLIHDLSLVARPGSTVAIVGPTGAGKTTLVNLVMRFYEVDGGRITFDGVDITSLPRTELRSRIGMVLQDTWLFEGSIRDNIAYGRPGATEEEILEAARATFVDRFVHSLPDGYDTVIDENGSNLSAGERQLVTIARAFLADPALLILDEATSSVDTRTELLRPAGDGRAAQRPYVVRDRPPALHHPRRRRHRGDGGRRHRRAGHPRRAAGRARRLRPAVRRAVRRRPRPRHRRAVRSTAAGQTRTLPSNWRSWGGSWSLGQIARMKSLGVEDVDAVGAPRDGGR